MGLFKKKEVKKQEVPKEEVPLLPELSELPEIGEETLRSPPPISQLPSFPTRSFKKNFSQNIKEAVSGQKEGEDVFGVDDFAEEDEMRMMQKSLQKLPPFAKTERTRPLDREITGFPEQMGGIKRGVKKEDSIFIRIDRFEEGLELFEKIKKQISEIEELLREIKNTKEKEERELELWEKEIQAVKEKIERIDNEIFSKVE